MRAGKSDRSESRELNFGSHLTRCPQYRLSSDGTNLIKRVSQFPKPIILEKFSPCNCCRGHCRFHSDSLTLVKRDVLPSLNAASSIVLLIYVGG